MSVSVRRLEDPTESQIDTLAQTLYDAFHLAGGVGKDPLAEAYCRGDRELGIEFKRSTIRASVVGGQVLVAKYGDEDLVGMVALFGPGQAIQSTPEARAQGLDQFLTKIPQERIDFAVNTILKGYGTANSKVLGPNAWYDEWSLIALAASPRYQSKGIGKALMKACEEQVRAAKGLLILGTDIDANVAYYKGLGYELRGQNAFDAGFLGTINCSTFVKDFRE